jgi:hypothetical protein
MQLAVFNGHRYFPAFLLLPQKKRGQAKMLPYTLAWARPLLSGAIPRPTLEK